MAGMSFGRMQQMSRKKKHERWRNSDTTARGGDAPLVEREKCGALIRKETETSGGFEMTQITASIKRKKKR